MTNASIRVTVRAFARYAELLGHERFALDLPRGATVADAVAQLRSSVENGQLIPDRPLVAVNLEHVHHDRIVIAGEELAILPPLAGG